MKRWLFPAALATVAGALTMGGACANDFEKQIKDLAQSQIRPWLSSPQVIEAVKAQNAANASLSEADILRLDKEWRAETTASAKPLIEKVSTNPLSAFLTDKRKNSGGVISEIFVMDDKGLNVGLSDVTSDYWQGDEAKWQKTFLAGPDAIHISEVEKDESTQAFESQVSLPVTDPADGKVIGAITVGVNVEKLPQ